MNNELPDIIAARLDVLFCGINPGMMAAATGQHFAGRSNRFWRVIHLAGFTPKQMLPEQARELLDYGCGVTAVVKRATARADQLSPKEFTDAAAEFNLKVAHFTPRFVAFLGKAAYSGLSGRRDIAWGRQPNRIEGAAVWVLPNPSGRNLAFDLEHLVEAYRLLHRALAAYNAPAAP